MKRYTIRLGVTREAARGIWPDLDPSEAPECIHFSAEYANDDDAVRAMAQALVIHGSPWSALEVHTPAARRHGHGSYRVASWTPRLTPQPVREPKPWFAAFGARKPVEVSR